MNHKIEQILEEVDRLIKSCKLDEALSYMLENLDKARKEADYFLAITLLNELCGFYRDTGKLQKAVDCCLESEELLDKAGVGKTKERAAAYLNTANAFRANHDLDKSFEYYKKARAILDICADAELNSSYYNNLSLLHQEAGKFDEAQKCLRQALYIATEYLNDEVRIAISRTNLASTLIRMKRLDEAREMLEPALEIFRARIPSDFHYSAALSAMGDLYMLSGQGKKAASIFEMALSEIDLHMGHNNFYEIVSDNLETAYNMSGGRESVSGLALCREYFRAFGEPAIKKHFKDIIEHIAFGLAGEGSECLSFDDHISRDHDFGPGFCIWVDDKVSDKDIKRLEDFYSMLPKEYMGVKRLETLEGKGRVGVIRIKDALKKATGFESLPKSEEQWQYTVDENLLLIVNGEIFLDEGGVMTSIRKAIRSSQPHYVYFNKLAMQLELMAKHGQYGYKRALERDDKTAAFIAKSEFIKAAMRAMHIVAGKYAPYNKWLRRSLEGLKEFRDLAKLIDKLVSQGVSTDDIIPIEDICDGLRKSLISRGLITGTDTYLLAAAYELKSLAARAAVADEIVELEFAMFNKTKNIGGRASCQDDWTTFSIMRRSQYYTWPMELLQTLLVDYTQAYQLGRNVITEKYGYMMEYNSPEEYEKIKDGLPKLSEDKRKVIDAIVALQVGWMESFAKEYPDLVKNARTIHTGEDSLYLTSSETYLRGELSTYHDDTLTLYGRFVVDMSNKQQNLNKKIMNMTTFMYGYPSLEAAMEANK